MMGSLAASARSAAYVLAVPANIGRTPPTRNSRRAIDINDVPQDEPYSVDGDDSRCWGAPKAQSSYSPPSCLGVNAFRIEDKRRKVIGSTKSGAAVVDSGG